MHLRLDLGAAPMVEICEAVSDQDWFREQYVEGDRADQRMEWARTH